jgi:hypothetical protein
VVTRTNSEIAHSLPKAIAVKDSDNDKWYPDAEATDFSNEFGYLKGFDMRMNKSDFMSAAYNCDMYSLDFYDDRMYDLNPDDDGGNPTVTPGYGVDTYSWEKQDDDIVKCFQAAFDNGVKVLTMPWFVYPLAGEGNYGDSDNLFNEYAFTHDGESNPISLMASLCADNDIVYVGHGGGFNEDSSDDWTMIRDDAGNILNRGLYHPNDAKNIFCVATFDELTGECAKSSQTDDDGESLGIFPNSTAGTTYDGRVKPDIVMHGRIQSEDGSYILRPFYNGRDDIMKTSATGSPSTYYSCVQFIGFVALLREARPELNAHQIRECILKTASQGSAPTTDGVGYGLPDLEAAYNYEPETDENDEPAWGSTVETVLRKSVDEIPTINGANRVAAASVMAAPTSWVYANDDVSLDDMKSNLEAQGLKVRNVFNSMNALTVSGANKEQVEQAVANVSGVKKVRPSRKVRLVRTREQ